MTVEADTQSLAAEMRQLRADFSRIADTLHEMLRQRSGHALNGEVLFSVRPQSIGLHRSAPVRDSACVVEGRLVQRTFLGETWDYVVSPVDSTLRLKVTALPFQVFEVGQAVWLEFDPSQMAPVAA